MTIETQIYEILTEDGTIDTILILYRVIPDGFYFNNRTAHTQYYKKSMNI